MVSTAWFFRSLRSRRRGRCPARAVFPAVAAGMVGSTWLLPAGHNAPGAAAGDAPAPPAVVSGRIALPHVTGAVMTRGDRLLLTTSEPDGVALVPRAGTRLRGGQVALAPEERLEPALRGKIALEDLRDAAWDGAGDAYLLGSHARTPGGESPEARYCLGRLHFDATGKLLEARQSGAFFQTLVNEVPFLADSVRRTPAKAGLNIEGLAWVPEGHLLVGLRSPTVTESQPRPHGGQEDAVVLRVRNPEELFGKEGAAQFGDTVKLDLRGQGIRGMADDPKLGAVWLLAGLSVAPNHPVRSPWSLWLWKEGAAPREARLPAGIELESPEAVCRLLIEEQQYLLLTESGATASRYVLLPVPEVAK